jgi:hypothetical protein
MSTNDSGIKKTVIEKKLEKFYNKHPFWNTTRVILTSILSLLGILVLVVTLIQLIPPNYSLTNNELKTRTEYLVKDMMDFVIERETLENGYLYSFNQTKFLETNAETKNLYVKNFGGEVNFLYGEYNKRGKRSQIIDQYVEWSFYNVNSIREIALLLDTWEKEF